MFWSRCQCQLRPCIQPPPGVGVSLPSVKSFAEGLRTSIVLACRDVLLKGPRAGRGIRLPIMAADLAFHSLGLFGFYESSNLASCPLSILRNTKLSGPSPSIPTPGPRVPFLLALGLGLSQATVQPMLAGSLVLGLAVAKVGPHGQHSDVHSGEVWRPLSLMASPGGS